MKRVFLLYNTKSGKEKIVNDLSDIVEMFTRSEYEITIRPTLYAGEATKIALSLQDTYDLLVCCGGDGTLNEIVSGVLQRESPIELGYIPCGSTNDFGNTIYGETNVSRVVERITKGIPHMTDCGVLGDKTFVYAAAFGLFTDISYETPHSSKATLGHAAYLLEAAKNIGNIKVQKATAIINESETISGDFLVGMITNADYVGGFHNVPGKDVSLHDGLLELTIILRPNHPAEYGKVLQAVLEGTQNEYVIRRKVENVRFITDEPVPYTVDGEYGGTYKDICIHCSCMAYTLVY